MFEVAAPFPRTGQITVVAQGQLALVAVNDNRLRVHQRSVAGRRVARMSERCVAGKPRKHVGLKNIRDQAETFFKMQFPAVARDDARRFLSAMLQRVEAQIGHLRGLGMAEDSAHAAVIVETIVVYLNQTAHSAFRKSVSRRSLSIAPDHTSATGGISALTTTRPFSSMRK